jgi:uncharacterized protein (DUF58 family)
MPTTLALNANAMAAIDDLAFLARTVVEGFLEGLHRSPFLGYSTEFSAYRAYTHGDDPGYIDWKLWARCDKYYVKQFEDDTNLSCQIFLDTSASMDFGGGDHNKFTYGRILAAVLAYLMTHQHDAPGLVLFGEKASQAVPPKAARHHADEIFQVLSHLHAQGGTNIGADLFGVLQCLTRRGVSVVISDFFAAGDTALELLRQLHSQRQEIIVLHLLCPEELDFPYRGALLLQDSETAQEKPVHAEAFRDKYLQRLNQYCAELRNECVKLEVDYQLLRTDQPLDFALMAYLEKRNAV